MATDITVFIAQLNALLSATDSELNAIDRQKMVETAIQRYSHDLPEIITVDVAGDAGRYYPITNLAAWVDGFSQIQSIQYPAEAVSEDEIPQYLEPEDWDDNYRDGSDVHYILLPNHSPAATENFRVAYSTTYQPASGAYNTPVGDFFAICNLAAYFSCLAIAANYGRTNDSLISADSVDHGGRSERFRNLARDFERAYLEHMDMTGDNASRERPTGEFVDWDTMPAPNRRYLFHNNR